MDPGDKRFNSQPHKIQYDLYEILFEVHAYV